MAERRKKAQGSSVQEVKKDGPTQVLDKFLTVEPIVIIHMTTALLAFMAVQDLLLVKACQVNYGYSDEVCAALKEGTEEGKYVEENKNVQELTGFVLMWRTMLENVFPMALICLIGAWSDKYGRKIPLLVVILSFVIQHILLVFSALDKSLIGANSVGVISSLIVSLAGNNACFMTCIFSYVSDTTLKEKMTQKMATTGSSIFLGVCLGMGLAGVFAKFGFVFIFTLAAAGEAFNLFYLYYGFPNVLRDPNVYKKVTPNKMFMELFDKKHVVDAVGSAFKKRPGNDRMKLLGLLASHCAIMAPMFGESAVLYLYGRIQFNWDTPAYSAFMTYRMIMGFVGNIVSNMLMINFLKMSDPALGVVSVISASISLVMFAFATTNFVMYLAPIVALLAGSINAVPRTLIFKVISGDEAGKVNAFMGSLESLTPLLITPVYSFVYAATQDYLPGGFFILSAALLLIPLLVFGSLMGEKTKTK